MAVIGHAGPVELEAWREELRTVLESRPFRQAPTLAHLLRYLCEKLFAGESSQIKEYSIGVEMFRRGAEFDQDTDSIVRVEVNRLRKRLADYYAGEGASHKLQIAIPVGQYVPELCERGARTGGKTGTDARAQAGAGGMVTALADSSSDSAGSWCSGLRGLAGNPASAAESRGGCNSRASAGRARAAGRSAAGR